MKSKKTVAGAVSTAVALLALSPFNAQKAKALTNHNVPKGVEVAADRGRVAAGKDQKLTLVLKMHDQAGFDKTVEELYDPASPRYQHWLSEKELEKYAPTAAEYETVKQELTKQGLTVVSEDPQRFTLRVHANTEAVERAFHTELHTFSHNGKEFQAHTRDAELRGVAGEMVDSVVGLERRRIVPMAKLATNPKTGKPVWPKTPLKTMKATASGPLGTITDVPLSPPALVTYKTPGASLPLASYYGNIYDKDPSVTVSYKPTDLQKHYGLTSLIKDGYDGSGQTVALIEGFGYAYDEADANAASKIFGLPLFTSANFASIYPEGKPLDPDAVYDEGWNVEIAIDIQSAHSVAPGAKILVVNSSSQDEEDFIASIEYVISHRLANSVSSSWETDAEFLAGSSEENAYNAVLKRGASIGISLQFSTGDGGDEGLGTPVGDVLIPSNSPYATAVGGTSILNNTNGAGDVVTGWGNDVAYLNLSGPLDPPFAFFNGGAGGGESLYYPKPAWQKSLPGTGRQTPDVSALADPFTGFAIVVSDPTGQYFEPGWGGTSLASPLFTGMWAIATQYNGKPIGEAGQIVGRLKSTQIRDVLPTNDLEAGDVAGAIYDSSGATFYSASGLFAGLLYNQTEFTSAIWNIASDEGLALSFGTDSSLTVTPGWDNVTGYGEPNGLPFIQGVTGKTKGAELAKK